MQFSKVNSLRKGISGPSSQEETYLKFSQTEGNFKAMFLGLKKAGNKGNKVNPLLLLGPLEFTLVLVSGV